MSATQTTIHTGHDGARGEIYTRGNDRVLLIRGRGADTKRRRLVAAGFAWRGVCRANDTAEIVLDGAWLTDGLPLIECAACGATPEALIALARGL